MNKFVLFFCFLLLFGSLLAVPVLQEFKAHDYQYVSRTVFTFDSPVLYDISSPSPDKPMLINVRRATKSPSFVAPQLQNSRLIQSLSVVEHSPAMEIYLEMHKPYRYEVMGLDDSGFKIVVDIFEKDIPGTYEAQLSVANFYFTTHAYKKAQNILENVAVTYPEKQSVHYYMAKNLAGLQKNEEAVAQLKMVPASEPEHRFAQVLLGELVGLKNGATIPDSFFDSRFDAVLYAPQAKDSVAQTTPQAKTAPASHRNFIDTFTKAQIPLWLSVALMLLLLLINIIQLAYYHKRLRGVTTSLLSKDDSQEPMLFTDAESKRKMVSRLIHAGWNNKEIAKELRIDIREVEHVVKQLSISESD